MNNNKDCRVGQILELEIVSPITIKNIEKVAPKFNLVLLTITRKQVLSFDGVDDVFLDGNDDDDDKVGGSSELHNYHQTKSD